MARAFAKVILLGEHAVVYGVPALVAGLSRGATVHAEPSSRHWVRIEGAPEIEADRETEAALAALCRSLGAPAMRLDVVLDVPAGSGLGASAAIGVAAARAVMERLSPELPASLDRVLEAAAAWEGVFHGNPSGIDAAAAALGGCLYFQRGEPPERVAVGSPVSLAVVKAGPPASTRAMVEHVAMMKKRRPEVFEKTLRGIEAVVKNGRTCIEQGDLAGLGKLFDLNQMLLSGLMLSTPEIEQACAIARGAGALGAKLTGAGGGGAVVALVEDVAPVLHAWQVAGFNGFAASITARASSP